MSGVRPATWTSTYGSLVVTGYDIATADGMNEEGLVANLLWEVEAAYPEDDGETPRVSISVFPQYLLDRFVTVAEGVTDLRENPVEVAGGEVPVHVSLSDATGDSAVIEFVEGEMKIWHDRSYQSMTNEPTYDRRYYLESVISPSVFWVDLDNFDFAQGSDVVKLDLGVDIERVLSGEVSAAFEAPAPFAFQPAD